ncbi:MAG: energy transducer TonB [Flavobacteriales bacterium]|jgi:protein TonB|nr:MAG: energy transducer TonB [Flavobacteriales bacterium]
MKLRAIPLIRRSFGVGVFAFLTAPVLYAQEEVVVPAPVAPPITDPDAPLLLVEQMPEYPGGQQAMFAFISKELKYPEEAIDNGIEGTVVISFVVERDGSIGEAKVLRGLGGGCSEEALRVVKSMPLWKPGMQGGKLVRTSYNLPIRFKLQDKRPKR